jgi:hypothetical protein
MTQEQRELESEIRLLDKEIDMMEKRVQSLLSLDDALRRIEESGLDLEADFPAILPSRLYLLPPEATSQAGAPDVAAEVAQILPRFSPEP